MARKLRIAVSVFFGLLTLALCVLWVRSYWRWDSLDGDGWTIASNCGRIVFQRDSGTIQHVPGFDTVPADERANILLKSTHHIETTLGFGTARHAYESVAIIPYWFFALPTVVALAFVLVPQASVRFSLRTLLIATTLVAAELGLAVWATR